MGQYHILVNLDKKEYVEPHLLKHMNHLHDSRSLPHVQYLLSIAQGNNPRGGGDAYGHDLIGSWCKDRCAIVGDYYTEDTDDEELRGLYDIAQGFNTDYPDRRGWKNISKEAFEMMDTVYSQRGGFLTELQSIPNKKAASHVKKLMDAGIFFDNSDIKNTKYADKYNKKGEK